MVDWEAIIAPDLWRSHWDNLERLHELMRECQKVADQVRLVAASAAVAKCSTSTDR